MSTTLNLQTLDQARQYTRTAVCAGCQKTGSLSAFEVKKESPNQGRLFARCRHCGHFDWLSAARVRDEELERVQESAGPCPKCGKGRRAQRAQKEGPNQGRLFLVCADPACDSFAWASPGPRPSAPKPAPLPPTQGERTQEGLLADIRDHPEDDTPRLIYADWLDEHDQPARAELIRVQVAQDRLADDPAWDGLEDRAQALLAENREAWAGPLRAFALGCPFVRGMIDPVFITAAALASHFDEVLRMAPTAALHVPVESLQDVKTLVRCKQLLRVRRLTLLGGRMGGAGLRILAQSPNVAQLTRLCLAGQSLGQPGTGALAGSRYFANLEELDLSENNLSRSAIPLLASSPNLPRLRCLILARNLLTDSDLRALAASPYLGELRELDLAGNDITNEGVEALARSPLLAQLRRLDLSGCQVSQHSTYRLRQSPHAAPDLQVIY